MEHLDTAIAFIVVLIVVSELSAVVTDIINQGLKTRKTYFVEWQDKAHSRLDRILRVEFDLDETTRDNIWKRVTPLFEAEHSSVKPRVDASFLAFIIAEFAVKESNQIRGELVNRVALATLESADRDTTSRFRFNAGMKTTLISIGVALLMNMNAISLLSSLSKNQEARDQFALEQLKVLNENKKNTEDAAEFANLYMQIQELEEELDQNTSAPFGPTATYVDDGDWFKWLVGCIITGVLAGFGAPFWHKQLDRLLMTKKLVKEKAPSLLNRTANSGKTEEGGYVKIGSGESGSFKVVNPSWDKDSGVLDVDLEVIGDPESVLTKDELQKKIKDRFAAKYSDIINSVNIRSSSEKRISPYLFTNNPES